MGETPQRKRSLVRYVTMAAVTLFVGTQWLIPMYGQYRRTGSVTIPYTEYTLNLRNPLSGGPAGEQPLGEGTSLTPSQALAELNKLPVKGKAPKTGYSRARFGAAWSDKAQGVQFAGNGCDTRDDILKRDLSNVVLAENKCTVLSGILHDPYTGKDIHFKRGPESARIQIDHIVPLGLAWITGAQLLSKNKRLALANDPRNLLAVDGPANGAKGDRDASGWMPPNRKIWCSYDAAMVNVKTLYHLWVTPAEKDALTKVLSGCR